MIMISLQNSAVSGSCTMSCWDWSLRHPPCAHRTYRHQPIHCLLVYLPFSLCFPLMTGFTVGVLRLLIHLERQKVCYALQ